MKKFLSLVAIALIATPMFTSCDKDDDDNVTPPTPGKQELSLSVDKASLAAEATGTFTVTASAKAAEAIVVNVVSDKVANVTVPATVTIAKGTTSITGTYTAVAEGAAKITISTTAKGVTVKVADANITVTKKGVDPEPVESKIIYVANFGFTCEDGEGSNWSAVKAGADAAGKGGYGSSVFYTTTAFDGTTGDPRIVIDNYGADVVGTTDASGICIAFVPVDTPIDGSLAWVKNEAHGEGFLGDNTGTAWFAMPNLVSSSYTALVGKEGYIVTNFVGFDDTDTAFQVRGWMKVSVTATSVTIIDYAVIVGDGAFKVGQTK